MQAGRHRSSALRTQWATVLSSKGSGGLEKTTSSFLGVVAPPWCLVRCVFKSAEGWSGPQTPVLGLNQNAGLIPSPTQ